MIDPALAGIPIAAGGIGGGWLLRRAWRARIADKPPYRRAGWAVLAATMVAAAWLLGAVRGPFVALCLIPVAVLALVAGGATVRAAKTGRSSGSGAGGGLAPEPLVRPARWWQTTLRWLLAGPIGMIAAMAIGIAYATLTPGAAQTRLLIGGLIVPVVWGAAMAWTLADNRILRATFVLLATTLAGFGAAFLKGFV